MPFNFAGPVRASSPAIVHLSDPVDFPSGVHHSGDSKANIQSKLFDLDGDGKLDFFFADWHGQAWPHRNTGASGPPYTFAAGKKCVRQDNTVINVDLTHADEFVQKEGGARPVFTLADFEKDGKQDLVLGDTFGNVRFLRGACISSARVSPGL